MRVLETNHSLHRVYKWKWGVFRIHCYVSWRFNILRETACLCKNIMLSRAMCVGMSVWIEPQGRGNKWKLCTYTSVSIAGSNFVEKLSLASNTAHSIKGSFWNTSEIIGCVLMESWFQSRPIMIDPNMNKWNGKSLSVHTMKTLRGEWRCSCTNSWPPN
jgi:hypothetical protein